MEDYVFGKWTACSASDGNCECGLVWDDRFDQPLVAVQRKYAEEDRLFPKDFTHKAQRLVEMAPAMARALRKRVENTDTTADDEIERLIQAYIDNLGPYPENA